MKRLLFVCAILFTFALVAFAQDDTLPPTLEDDTYEFELTNERSTNLFTFYAEEGDEVTIEMTQIDPDLDPFIVVIGPGGVLVAADDDSGDVALSSLIEDLEIEETGLYTLMASSYIYIDLFFAEQWADQPDEQAYELTIDGTAGFGDVSDIEDVLEDAGYMVIEDGFDDTIDLDDDMQAAIFAFEASEGDEISIDLAIEEASEFFTPLVHLFNEDGERVAIDYGLDDYEIEDDGVYWIVLVDSVFYTAVDYGTVAEDDLSVNTGTVEFSFSQD